MTSKERLGGIFAALEAVSPLLQVQVMSTVGQLIAEAVAAEREACALIADGQKSHAEQLPGWENDEYQTGASQAAEVIAEKIRSRSTEAPHV